MSRKSARSAGRISCSGRWPSCGSSESVADRLFTAGQLFAGRHSVASKGENEVQAANFMNVGSKFYFDFSAALAAKAAAGAD